MTLLLFFKQKTAYEMRISDWSSDVCSSDLRSRTLLAETMHAEPPLQGDDGALGGLEQSDHQRHGERQDNGHKRRDGQVRVADQRDDERRHQMSGHEYRDIGRKIIGLLVRPVLRALRAAW